MAAMTVSRLTLEGRLVVTLAWDGIFMVEIATIGELENSWSCVRVVPLVQSAKC